MNQNDKNVTFDTNQSVPITIPTTRGRARSVSVSSASSGSTNSSEVPTTPSSSIGRISIPSPSNSPILSYFRAQSPAKTSPANSFAFRKFGTSPVFEEEEIEKEPSFSAHARRASATIATRLTQPPSSYASEASTERATNLLRRLSLGTPAFAKPMADICAKTSSPPSPPPNSAVTPPSSPTFVHKPRRSATISTGSRPRRAPSPMGERILKGHFDGFN